jgi:hypothetical protein
MHLILLRHISGVLVLTQHLNRKYRISNERHITGWACYDTDHKSLMKQLFHCYDIKTAVKRSFFFRFIGGPKNDIIPFHT